MRDVLYQYDGTFDGFLCCIHDSYLYKEIPAGFSSDGDFLSLYEVRIVPTQAAHSQRVYRGLAARSNKAAKAVYRGFLTCMEDKELRLYAFVRKVFREGDRFMQNLSDPVFYPLHKALRHMSGELEKLRGFVRFSDYNGVLGAVIEPENQVLPMLRRHFCGRYSNEAFFIFDRTHREILLYARGISRIQPLERLDLAAPEALESVFRDGDHPRAGEPTMSEHLPAQTAPRRDDRIFTAGWRCGAGRTIVAAAAAVTAQPAAV